MSLVPVTASIKASGPAISDFRIGNQEDMCVFFGRLCRSNNYDESACDNRYNSEAKQPHMNNI